MPFYGGAVLKKMPTAVIFDMDGVIFDTERVYLDSCVSAAGELGLGDVQKLCISCIGVTEEVTKKRFAEAIPDPELCARFWETARSKTRETLSRGMPVKEGARELLQKLYTEGIPTALASSTRTETVIRELISVDLFGFFTRIVGGDMVSRSKPDPEIFLKAADMLGVPWQECLVLEDSKNGLLSAKAAGMTVYIIPDLVPIDDEMKEKADMILPSLADVWSELKKDA